MRSPLDRVKDWDAVAIECRFQVHAVAARYHVTDRQLERYFHRRFGMTPKAWMDDARIDIAIERLLNGDPGKVVAGFPNFFKRH